MRLRHEPAAFTEYNSRFELVSKFHFALLQHLSNFALFSCWQHQIHPNCAWRSVDADITFIFELADSHSSVERP